MPPIARACLLGPLLALGALVAFAALGRASAAPCGPAADMRALLLERYREVPAGAGITGKRALVTLFRSRGGTWTVLAQAPDGSACIVAGGRDWEPVEPDFTVADPDL